MTTLAPLLEPVRGRAGRRVAAQVAERVAERGCTARPGAERVPPRALALTPVIEPRAWDRAMVDRILAGDDSALAAVYDRYGAVVHGIAARLVGADQANEITQDVLLHLWEHAETYDPGRSGLCGFLALIARRRAIDALRSRERRAAREQRAFAADVGVARAVEDDALAAVSASRVRFALDHLPEPQRTAIELAYFGGLSFREVARATGWAEGTTKSRLRLGLEKLARELDESSRPGVNA